MINIIFFIFSIGLILFVWNPSKNLIVFAIGLELLLLATAFLSAYYSYILDDLQGTTIALLILPLAGAESAVLLSYLITYGNSMLLE